MVDISGLEYIVYNPYKDESVSFASYLTEKFNNKFSDFDLDFFKHGAVQKLTEEQNEKLNKIKSEIETTNQNQNLSALKNSFTNLSNHYNLNYENGTSEFSTTDFINFMGYISKNPPSKINETDLKKYQSFIHDFSSGSLKNWISNSTNPLESQIGLSAQRLIKLNDLKDFNTNLLKLNPFLISLGYYTENISKILSLENVPLQSSVNIISDSYIKDDVEIIIDKNLFNKIKRNKKIISSPSLKNSENFKCFIKRTVNDIKQKYDLHNFVLFSSNDYSKIISNIISKIYNIKEKERQISSYDTTDEFFSNLTDNERINDVYVVDLSLSNGDGFEIISRIRERCGVTKPIIAISNDIINQNYQAFAKSAINLIDKKASNFEKTLESALKQSMFLPPRPTKPKILIFTGDSCSGKTSLAWYITDLYSHIKMIKKYVSRPQRPTVMSLTREDSIHCDDYMDNNSQYPILHAKRNGHNLWINTSEIVNAIEYQNSSVVLSATPPSIVKDIITKVNNGLLSEIKPNQVFIYLFNVPDTTLNLRQKKVIEWYDKLICLPSNQEQEKINYEILKKEINERKNDPIRYTGLKKYCTNNGCTFRYFSGKEAINPFNAASIVIKDVYGKSYHESLDNIFYD